MLQKALQSIASWMVWRQIELLRVIQLALWLLGRGDGEVIVPVPANTEMGKMISVGVGIAIRQNL